MNTLLAHPYLTIVTSCLLAAAAQLLLKLGTTGSPGWQSLARPELLGGLLLYAIGMALWLLSLSRLSLQVAYAFTALTFLLVYAGSIVVLGEPLGLRTGIGAGLILFGFLIIATARHGS